MDFENQVLASLGKVWRNLFAHITAKNVLRDEFFGKNLKDQITLPLVWGILADLWVPHENLFGLGFRDTP